MTTVHHWLVLALINSLDFLRTAGGSGDVVENWPRPGIRNASVENATEGQAIRLRCAGRIENAAAHWEFKACRRRPNTTLCYDDVDAVEDDESDGECWRTLAANASTLALTNVNRLDEGLYRCRQAATPYINIYYTIKLKVLPRPDKDDELPHFLDGLPKNITVQKDSQAVFQCKVSSKTPVSIMWVWQGAAPGAFRHMDEWYSPVGSDTVGLPGGTRLAKLVLSRPRLRHAGRYLCVAVNTRGYSNSSAYLQVIGDDDAKWEETRYFFFFFLLPVGLALLPSVIWLYYAWSRRRRLQKVAKDDDEQGRDVEMTLKLNHSQRCDSAAAIHG